MSPTSRELVSNRPLRGDELRSIILRNIDEVLGQDHTMASHVAYGRVGFEIRVSLHFDNPSFPEHVITARSRKPSDNMVDASPELVAVEGPPPLDQPSGNDYVRVVERSDRIDSPNLARIANGLPVTIVRSDGAGHSTEEGVRYPPSVAQGVGSDPVDTDLSRMARAAFNSKQSSIDMPPKESPNGDPTVQLASAATDNVGKAPDTRPRAQRVGSGVTSVPSTLTEEDRAAAANRD